MMMPNANAWLSNRSMSWKYACEVFHSTAAKPAAASNPVTATGSSHRFRFAISAISERIPSPEIMYTAIMSAHCMVLLQDRHHRVNGCFRKFQYRRRESPKSHHQDYQRIQHDAFAYRQIRKQAGSLPLFAEHGHLVAAQHVHCTEYHRESSEGAKPCIKSEQRIDQHEFAHKSAGQRQRDATQQHDHKHRSKYRCLQPDRSQPRHILCTEAGVDNVDNIKQCHRCDPVTGHLDHGTLDANAVECQYTRCNQPHVRHRRVGNKSLQVLLYDRSARREHDPDDREYQRRIAFRTYTFGNEWNEPTNEAIYTHLKHDARQQ